ncbi:hypothetical protein [Mesorhizobium sp.]|uniref:hypothetical protein n=1 Tax=Mesorhizobium sp. TaxID=1871066 RepID=UPI0025C51D1D|nr:hypothetical protein [Mesorhizobium sp.]
MTAKKKLAGRSQRPGTWANNMMMRYQAAKRLQERRVLFSSKLGPELIRSSRSAKYQTKNTAAAPSTPAMKSVDVMSSSHPSVF